MGGGGGQRGRGAQRRGRGRRGGERRQNARNALHTRRAGGERGRGAHRGARSLALPSRRTARGDEARSGPGERGARRGWPHPRAQRRRRVRAEGPSCRRSAAREQRRGRSHGALGAPRGGAAARRASAWGGGARRAAASTRARPRLWPERARQRADEEEEEERARGRCRHRPRVTKRSRRVGRCGARRSQTLWLPRAPPAPWAKRRSPTSCATV